MNQTSMDQPDISTMHIGNTHTTNISSITAKVFAKLIRDDPLAFW